MIENDVQCKFLITAMNEDIITTLQSLANTKPDLLEVSNTVL